MAYRSKKCRVKKPLGVNHVWCYCPRCKRKYQDWLNLDLMEPLREGDTHYKVKCWPCTMAVAGPSMRQAVENIYGKKD